MFRLENTRYSSACRQIRNTLEQNRVECFRAETKWILESLGLPLEKLLLFDGVLNDGQARAVEKIVNRRLKGEPLQYILGTAYFLGLPIAVEPGVLIPRPETELLAQQAAALLKPGMRALDLCCGSGCIGIALARKSGAEVDCADISPACLRVAARNAKDNGVEVGLIESDLLENINGKYALIACNPPYIPSGEIAFLQREVRKFEPQLALDGGADGLDYYRRLARDVAEHLQPGGHLLLEVGHDQAKAVAGMLKAFGRTRILEDLNHIERIVWATL